MSRPRVVYFLAILVAVCWYQPALRAQSLEDLGDVFGEGEAAEQSQQESAEQPEREQPFDPFAQQPDDSQAEEQGKTLEQAMAEAKALSDEGKVAEAIDLYSQILAQQPTYSPAELEKGKNLLKLEEYNLALKSFTQVEQLATADTNLTAEALREQAKVYLRQSQLNEALDAVLKAIEYRPVDAELLYLRGKALNRLGQAAGLQGQGNFNLAIQSLNRCLSIDSEYADAYSERAISHAFLREFPEAIQDLNRAVELKPDDPNLLARQGVILSRRAEFERDRFEPDMGQVVSDYKAAIKAFDAYLQLQKGKTRQDFRNASPDEFTPGQVYQEKAQVQIELASEVDPSQSRELYEAAIANCDAALEFDDRSAVAVYQRAIALRMLGDLPGAIKSLSHSIRINASSEAYLRRGIAYFYEGEFVRARGDFLQALDVQAIPDGRTKFWIGATYAREGDFLTAIQYYTECLRENPEYKPAYSSRALAYMQVGQYRRAEQDFEELVRRDQNDSVAIQRRDRARTLAKQNGQ